MINSLKGLSSLIQRWKQSRTIPKYTADDLVSSSRFSAAEYPALGDGGGAMSSSFSTLSHVRHIPSRVPAIRAKDAEGFIDDRFTGRDMIEYNINYAVEVLQKYFPEANILHLNIPNVEHGSEGELLKTLEQQREILSNAKPTYVITTVRGIDVGHHEGDYDYRKYAHHAVLLACNDFTNPEEVRFFYDVNGVDGYGGKYQKVMSDLKDDLAVFFVNSGAEFSGAKIAENEERSTIARGVCAQATFEVLVRALEGEGVRSLAVDYKLDSAEDLKDYSDAKSEHEREMLVKNTIAKKIREMNGLKKYMVAYREEMIKDCAEESSFKFITPTYSSKLKQSILERD